MNTRRSYPNRKSVLLAGLAGGTTALWWFRSPLSTILSTLRDQQAISAFVQQFGVVGPLVLFALLVAQVFFAVLPGQALMLAAGYLYGFSTGALVAGAGTILGGQLTFCLARWGRRGLVNRLASPHLIERWDRLAAQQGGTFFFFTFILPIYPSDLMSYIAGLGRVPARKFFIANLFGRMPCAICLALVGAYGFKLPFQLYFAAGAGLAILFFAWLVYARRNSIALDLGASCYAAARSLVRGYISLFRLRCKFLGATALPAGPKILAANHPNATDVFFLASVLPERLYIVIQGNLFRLPILGWLLSRSGQIPVKPECREQAFERTCDLLRKGCTVLIFPEGILNLKQLPVKAGTGAVRMSLATGAPIIPIGIYTAGKDSLCLRHRSKTGLSTGYWQVRGRCLLKFGEPWYPEEEAISSDASLSHQHLTDELIAKIYSLANEAGEAQAREDGRNCINYHPLPVQGPFRFPWREFFGKCTIHSHKVTMNPYLRKPGI